MSKPDSGLFHGAGNEFVRYQQLRAETRATVQELIRSTPGSKKKSAAAGAYDRKTGKIAVTFAEKIPEQIAPELLERAELIGGLGSYGLTEHNIVGVCAEFHAVNNLLLAGSSWSDIRITPVIRPRTGKEIPHCDNCKAMFYDLIDK